LKSATKFASAGAMNSSREPLFWPAKPV